MNKTWCPEGRHTPALVLTTGDGVPRCNVHDTPLVEDTWAADKAALAGLMHRIVALDAAGNGDPNATATVVFYGSLLDLHATIRLTDREYAAIERLYQHEAEHGEVDGPYETEADLDTDQPTPTPEAVALAPRGVRQARARQAQREHTTDPADTEFTEEGRAKLGISDVSPIDPGPATIRLAELREQLQHLQHLKNLDPARQTTPRGWGVRTPPLAPDRTWVERMFADIARAFRTHK